VISISSTNKPTRRRKILGIIGAFLTLIIPYLIFRLHSGNIENEQSFCPFKLLTGFPCPGCGITKSLGFLYAGDLAKSFYYHAFGLITFLVCMAAIPILSIEYITGREYLNSILYSRKIAYVLGGVLAGYHVIRLVYFISTHTWEGILQESVWG
jgi:hypothetical protein